VFLPWFRFCFWMTFKRHPTTICVRQIAYLVNDTDIIFRHFN
jgi:hypothetical protein